MVRGVQLQKQNTEVKISRRQSKTIVYYCYMILQYILCTFISPNISLSLLCSKHYTTIPLWIQPIYIWIDGRVLSKIHSPLLLHPSSLLFCPSDLCVLPDWPSWFNDLSQTGHSDRTGEKESQNLKQAEWASLLLTDQNSPILSLRFIFYFLHLFVLSPVALVSLYLQFIPLSFSDTAIHFSLPLKIPVPSSAFISNDHSSLPLSSSARFQSGFERSDRHAEWESVAEEPADSISNRNTCACTQTHLHRAFIMFCYFNKANVTKVLMMSPWCDIQSSLTHQVFRAAIIPSYHFYPNHFQLNSVL